MPELRAVRHRPVFGVTLAGLEPLPPAARYILRGGAGLPAAAAAARVSLPIEPCRAATEAGRAALWLGPDEWLLIAADADGPALRRSLESALAGIPHSLVDVGHRQSGCELRGQAATALLSAGCPLDLDLSTFPIGMCTRTVLAKAEVVLWRKASETFHLEVARSFIAYVSQFLAEAARTGTLD